MPNYRRWYVAGGQYFFTLVTWERMPIFWDPVARRLLGDSFRKVRARHPFQIPAIVLLPDHMHCIWTMPLGDAQFSMRWNEIKRHFTRAWHRGGAGCREAARSESRLRRQERCVWQRRFWEHFIRDEDDFANILDYIHYNPVRHGYVERPGDWPASSFGRYVRAGLYQEGWGRDEPKMGLSPDRGFE